MHSGVAGVSGKGARVARVLSLARQCAGVTQDKVTFLVRARIVSCRPETAVFCVRWLQVLRLMKPLAFLFQGTGTFKTILRRVRINEKVNCISNDSISINCHRYMWVECVYHLKEPWAPNRVPSFISFHFSVWMQSRSRNRTTRSALIIIYEDFQRECTQSSSEIQRDLSRGEGRFF